MNTLTAPDTRYPEMKTIADWNWWFGMNGTESYSIVGLTTNTGNTYCSNCVSHVHVFEVSDTAKVVYASDNYQGTCPSCNNKIGR